MLFGEIEFPERFDAAARAGFKAVEIQFPYALGQAGRSRRPRSAPGVEVVLINIPAGDPQTGRPRHRLPAGSRRRIPRRRGQGDSPTPGRARVQADELPRRHRAARRGPRRRCAKTYVANLRYASDELARAGMTLLVEPISTLAVPGFYPEPLRAEAFALVDEAGADNLKVQYDLYHMRIMGDDLAATIASNLGRIGHMQFADVPGRHEPGTGEIDFPELFDLVDRLGYRRLDRRRIHADGRAPPRQLGVGEGILVSCQK